jgi:hypothetical protein
MLVGDFFTFSMQAPSHSICGEVKHELQEAFNVVNHRLQEFGHCAPWSARLLIATEIILLRHKLLGVFFNQHALLIRDPKKRQHHLYEELECILLKVLIEVLLLGEHSEQLNAFLDYASDVTILQKIVNVASDLWELDQSFLQNRQKKVSVVLVVVLVVEHFPGLHSPQKLPDNLQERERLFLSFVD